MEIISKERIIRELYKIKDVLSDPEEPKKVEIALALLNIACNTLKTHSVGNNGSTESEGGSKP